MKIQSISPYKQNNFSNIYTYIRPCAQELIKNTNQFDSVSFKGSKVEYEEIRPIRMQAYETQLNATELLGKSNKVKREAYEALAIAKSEYIKGMNIIKVFKQDPQREVRKLKNGNELRFKSELKGDAWYLEASEHDSDGKAIRSLKAVDFQPVQITSTTDGFNNYQFTDKDVTIMQGMNIASANSGGAEAIYKFTFGKLTSAFLDLQALDNPQVVKNMYVYDDNGNLRIYSENNEKYDFKTNCDERYVLDENGKLLTYFVDFSSDVADGKMKFSESMHFDNGRFIAYTKDSTCDKKGDEIKSNDSYYLKDGEFEHSSDFHYLMTDLEPIIFEDKE